MSRQGQGAPSVSGRPGDLKDGLQGALRKRLWTCLRMCLWKRQGECQWGRFWKRRRRERWTRHRRPECRMSSLTCCLHRNGRRRHRRARHHEQCRERHCDHRREHHRALRQDSGRDEVLVPLLRPPLPGCTGGRRAPPIRESPSQRKKANSCVTVLSVLTGRKKDGYPVSASGVT